MENNNNNKSTVKLKQKELWLVIVEEMFSVEKQAHILRKAQLEGNFKKTNKKTIQGSKMATSEQINPSTGLHE